LNASGFTPAPDDVPMPLGDSPTGHPVDRELEAVRAEVERRLQSGLSKRGISDGVISVAAMTNCGSSR
jgi:hypothetical protein